MSLQYLDNVFRKIFKIKVAKLQNFFEPWSQIQVPEGREGFSDRLCKTLKLLQNIRNAMETAGKILENLVFVVLSLRYKLTELFHPFEKHIYHLG